MLRKGKLEKEILWVGAILVAFYFFILRKPIKPSDRNMLTCTGTCGGISPSSAGCSEGCECAKVDQNSADVMRDCIPIS